MRWSIHIHPAALFAAAALAAAVAQPPRDAEPVVLTGAAPGPMIGKRPADIMA